MQSLSETQFWFVAAAVALSPMLTLWIADVIGWFLRHTLWRPEVVPQPEREPAPRGAAGVAAPQA
jgi:hypothetical protein